MEAESYDHPAAWPIERLLAECTVRRQKRSGPGGQHRNKVETAVVVEHTPSGIRGEASERRSQDLNRQQAVQRLRVNLALEIRGPASAPGVLAAPSELWRHRTNAGRVACSPEHDDFPALLAEVLDAVTASLPDPAPAAIHLGVSTSQLVKFLAIEHRALDQLNSARAAAGMHRLK
jgi:hypothetical protein